MCYKGVLTIVLSCATMYFKEYYNVCYKGVLRSVILVLLCFKKLYTGCYKGVLRSVRRGVTIVF